MINYKFRELRAQKTLRCRYSIFLEEFSLEGLARVLKDLKKDFREGILGRKNKQRQRISRGSNLFGELQIKFFSQLTTVL